MENEVKKSGGMKNVSIWVSVGLFCLLYGSSGLYLLTQRHASSSSSNTETVWYILDSTDIPFSAAFPKQPTKESETLEANGISFPYISYSSEPSAADLFMITCCMYPDTADTSNPTTNLDGSVQGMVQTIHGTLLAKSYGTFQNFPCIDYHANTKEGVSIKGKNILVNKTLFSLSVTTTNPRFNDKEYSKFIESFKLK